MFRDILSEVNNINKNFAVNEEIRDREIRVIADDGEQLGVIATKEALRIAEEKELDLVMISPGAKPPVCKIMDYGKYIYEQSKKDKEAKKKQKVINLKEIILSIIIFYIIYKPLNQCISNYIDIAVGRDKEQNYFRYVSRLFQG